MEENEINQVAMVLIANSGDARSKFMEAIALAKDQDFDQAQDKFDEGKVSLRLAHQAQTDLLTQEAGGERVALSLLLLHAQDHLMNAMTVRDFAQELIDLYQHLA
ncbi:PTS lactose/cellobiose transporter subunit IIA [Facklamia languida]